MVIEMFMNRPAERVLCVLAFLLCSAVAPLADHTAATCGSR